MLFVLVCEAVLYRQCGMFEGSTPLGMTTAPKQAYDLDLLPACTVPAGTNVP